MKKVLVFILLSILYSCSNEDNNPEVSIIGKVVRLSDNTPNAISPKSIYIQDNDIQVTSYYKLDSSSNIEKLTHLVGDDESGISTVISFNEDSIINAIYQQDSSSGEITDLIFIKSENNVTYYGTEDETFSSSSNSDLGNYGNFLGSSEDMILANTLNLNRNILEQLKFISDNNTHNRGVASLGTVLAGAVAVAVALYFWDLLLDAATEEISCSYDETCNQTAERNANNENACNIEYATFICSEVENILDFLEESHYLEVQLCNGEICIVNIYSGNWLGNYTGNDIGNWSINVSQYGVVTGTANSTVFNQTFAIIGTLNYSGSLTATLGNVSSGSTFNGNMFGNNSASGSWQNVPLNMSGTWSGNKN